MESTSTTDTENPFKYCGEYVDEETGFVYLRNRYYDPSIGCFTTIDPAKDGLNWYVYCGNNPVNCYDSGGLSITSSESDSKKIIDLLEDIVANSLEFIYEDGQIKIKKTYDTENHVGQTLVSDLIGSDAIINVNVGADNNGKTWVINDVSKNGTMQVYIDPDNVVNDIEMGVGKRGTYTKNGNEIISEDIPNYILFGHELVHAWRGTMNLFDYSEEKNGIIQYDSPVAWREEELQTMGINYTDKYGNKMRDYNTYTGIISENGLRAENGLNSRVSYYYSH